MMQAPPTNALERHTMQQRLIAVPLPGRDRFAEDLFKRRGQQVGLEPRFGVAACLRTIDQDQGGSSGHGRIAIL